MSVNRAAFSLFTIPYLMSSGLPFLSAPVLSTIFYIGLVFSIFTHILLHPQPSPVRRHFAMFCDLGAISLLLHIGGEISSLFFPLYLWIIFGNGFRFGISAQFTATATAVAGFTIVIFTTQ